MRNCPILIKNSSHKLIPFSATYLGVYLHITVVFRLPFVWNLAANPCFSPMSPSCSINRMYRSMFNCMDSVLIWQILFVTFANFLILLSSRMATGSGEVCLSDEIRTLYIFIQTYSCIVYYISFMATLMLHALSNKSCHSHL
jgi:hypothetical protein